jgi:hypothetical protein
MKEGDFTGRAEPGLGEDPEQQLRGADPGEQVARAGADLYTKRSPDTTLINAHSVTG